MRLINSGTTRRRNLEVETKMKRFRITLVFNLYTVLSLLTTTIWPFGVIATLIRLVFNLYTVFSYNSNNYGLLVFVCGGPLEVVDKVQDTGVVADDVKVTVVDQHLQYVYEVLSMLLFLLISLRLDKTFWTRRWPGIRVSFCMVVGS